MYLLVADYYSKFLYILHVSLMTSKDVISALSFCFSVFGIPEEIIYDNATNFTSREYKEFATNRGFTLTASSSHYPRVMASLRDRCKPSRSSSTGVMKVIPTTIWLSKSFWKCSITASCNHKQSFSFNKQLKTTLPVNIRPAHNSEAVRAYLTARQDYSRYDAHSKEIPNLLPAQPIWAQDTTSKRWNLVVIKAHAESPLLIHHPDTTRQIQEKLLTSERGCNTNHSSRASEYNLQY